MSEPIRILFIGELHSSHALNWIDLILPLRNEFEVLGVHVSSAPPPETLFPVVNVMRLSLFQRYGLLNVEKIRNYLRRERPAHNDNPIQTVGSFNSEQLANVRQVLEKYKPHVVHTLGVFPASACFLEVLSRADLGCDPKWIVQARGGPDVALNRKIPVLAATIKAILKRCDCFVADNQKNYSFAEDMGLEPRKVSMTGPVPGTGGIDSSFFDGVPLPSHKERLILWPKAYNCIQSDGMSVLEALRLALPRIGKFRLIATAATPDVEFWFNEFLGVYGSQVEIHGRLPREKLLEIYRSARILLAPSLSDGVPNTMYEAMASHTVPILSPLDTLLPLFENNVHTIYAPNLNPPAIAEALVAAMNDDALADSIATINKKRVSSLSERCIVRDRVVDMYRRLVERKNN